MTTKILALADALGNLVRFMPLPGQRFDTVGVPPLIQGIEFGALIADKAFDSNDIIAALNKRGAEVVARAWTDPGFKARLLDNGTAAIAEIGFAGLKPGELRPVCAHP